MTTLIACMHRWILQLHWFSFAVNETSGMMDKYTHLQLRVDMNGGELGWLLGGILTGENILPQ